MCVQKDRRDGIQHTKKGIHHTKKEQNTQKKFPFFFLKSLENRELTTQKNELSTQKKNLAHKNNFINITVKSHILRHALKSGCLNLRTVPQLIGTLFFPLLNPLLHATLSENVVLATCP